MIHDSLEIPVRYKREVVWAMMRLSRPAFLAHIIPLALALPGILHATTVSWSHPSNGSWNDSAAWTPTTVPLPEDVAEFSISGAPYVVNLGSSVEVQGLNLSSSDATLALGAYDLFISQPGGFVNMSAGTLTSAGGSLAIANGSFTFNGGAILGNSVFLGNSNLEIGMGSVGAATFLLNGGSWIGNVAPTQSIQVDAESSTGASLINFGTIELGFFLNVLGTLTNSGTLSFPAMAGMTDRSILGNLTNTGSVNVGTNNAALLIGTTINQGNITVESGAFISLSDTAHPSGTFTQEAGNLNLLGNFAVRDGARFIFNGGVIAGNPVSIMENGSLEIGAASAGAAKFRLEGGSWTGNIMLAQTIQIASDGNTGASLINSGTIEFGTISDTSGGLLSISGTLTNSGTVSFPATTGMIERKIAGSLSNMGSVNVGTNNEAKFLGTTLNTGNVTIQPGAAVNLSDGSSAGTFTMAGGNLNVLGNFYVGSNSTFIFSGGIMTGNHVAIIDDGTLQLATNAPATFLMNGGTFSGNVSADQNIQLSPFPVGGAIASGSFTNSGRMEWQAQGTAGSGLTINSGTLTNEGELAFLNDSSPVTHSFAGNLLNKGEVLVETGAELYINAPTTVISNEGSMRIDGNFTMFTIATFTNGVSGRLSGSGTLSVQLPMVNEGTIAPGNSAGTLYLYASTEFAASSVLEIELESSSSFDHLNGSEIQLGGTLDIRLTNGFQPAYDDLFTIISSPALSGSFDNVHGNHVNFPGGAAEVIYSGNNVQLTHFVPEPSSSLLLMLAATLGTTRIRRHGNHCRQDTRY